MDRRPFYDHLASWASHFAQERVGVILINLENRVGADTPHQLGLRLASAARAGDIVARLGDDDFGVIVSPMQSSADAVAIGYQIHELLLPWVDAAVGMAFGPEHGADPRSLLHRADIAMHEARRRQLPFAAFSTAWRLDSPDRLNAFPVAV